MTIFGWVLCPVPCSHLACLHCILPGHCCSVSSLNPISSFFLSNIFFSPTSTRHFLSLYLCSSSLLSFPPHSPFHPVLSCFPIPPSSAHPPSLLFAPPIASFVLSSHYVLRSLVPSYPFPTGSFHIPGYSTGCALGDGSVGLWPVLELSTHLISPAA